MRDTKEYATWRSMMGRCTNPKHQAYSQYGGRGISVCERWHSFEHFYADMGRRPSPQHSLDRYPDNDGNYEISNCRWATRVQQGRNQSHNHRVEVDGQQVTLVEACERYGRKYKTVIARLRYGWTLEQALATPT